MTADTELGELGRLAWIGHVEVVCLMLVVVCVCGSFGHSYSINIIVYAIARSFDVRK